MPSIAYARKSSPVYKNTYIIHTHSHTHTHTHTHTYTHRVMKGTAVWGAGKSGDGRVRDKDELERRLIVGHLASRNLLRQYLCVCTGKTVVKQVKMSWKGVFQSGTLDVATFCVSICSFVPGLVKQAQMSCQGVLEWGHSRTLEPSSPNAAMSPSPTISGQLDACVNFWATRASAQVVGTERWLL